MGGVPVRYLALTLFFIPPLLLLAALDFDGQLEDVVRIEGIPFEVKKPDFAGEACLVMHLRSKGVEITQDDVFGYSGVDPTLGRGCIASELAVAAKSLGYDAGVIRREFDNGSRWLNLKKIWRELLADLKQQIPSIVCVTVEQRETFVLLIGYDPNKDQVIYHDPNDANGENSRVDRTVFLNKMLLKSADPKSSVVVKFTMDKQFMALQPPQSLVFSDAGFARHIRELRTKLPNEDFHIVIEKPFVVIGDESLNRIKQRCKTTIKWAVDRLKQDYFKNDPEHIIDIWLFKDKESYEENVQQLFGSKPHTPYGYYSSSQRILVMNINTGGGTLVHEIVHPFMENNFNDCPSWFNEGLASLYEQCADKDGHIWGKTNWRLGGLQRAIRAGRVPSFEHLCKTSTREFYDMDRGTNYAQARYLCYYLQQKGLLLKYYNAFTAAAKAKKDMTGYETLKTVLGTEDMVKFKKEWEAYVMKLVFR